MVARMLLTRCKTNPAWAHARSSCFALVLLGSHLVRAQNEPPIDGVVTGTDGQPIAGVAVYGSQSKTCCPFKRAHATTDSNGHFHLENPGEVLHFSADKFRPQAFVVAPQTPAVQVSLQRSSDELAVPSCTKPRRGLRRIGWGYGPQFDVPKRAAEILGGKPDVDYSRYVIKPKKGKGFLELWFGPYAMGSDPADEKFTSSVTFAQRKVVSAADGVIGIDSWGKLRNGEKWRQTAIVSQGARYDAAKPDDAALFDEIIDSLCLVTYPQK